MTDDLMVFLREQFNKDAREASSARAVLDIASKRRIIDLCASCDPEREPLGQAVLRLLALPYDCRPGYRESWRPGQCIIASDADGIEYPQEKVED
jgi:hypothetical protein